jgi:hypothetical protein
MRILRHFLLALLLLATQQAGLLHLHAEAGDPAAHALAAGGDETPDGSDGSGTPACDDCIAFAGAVPAPPASLHAFPGGTLRQVHVLPPCRRRRLLPFRRHIAAAPRPFFQSDH